MIFFCLKKLGNSLSLEVVCFFSPKRLSDVFCPEKFSYFFCPMRLGDFFFNLRGWLIFLSQGVG